MAAFDDVSRRKPRPCDILFPVAVSGGDTAICSNNLSLDVASVPARTRLT
jgi:hypothetical protein